MERFYRKIDDIRLYSINSPIFRFRLEEFIQILRRYQGLFGKKALDVGCGGGISTFALEKLGLNVLGIDIQEDMIKYAKEAAKILNSKAKFMIVDAKKFEAEEKFDSIFLLGNVIAHIDIKDFKEIIQRLKNYLQRNGVLVLHYFDVISEIWNQEFFVKSPQMAGKDVLFTYDSHEGSINITIIEKKLRDDLYEAERFKLYIWTPWILDYILENLGFTNIVRDYLPRNAYLDIYRKLF